MNLTKGDALALAASAGRRCIAIFAGRDIAEGEELMYHYMVSFLSVLKCPADLCHIYVAVAEGRADLSLQVQFKLSLMKAVVWPSFVCLLLGSFHLVRFPALSAAEGRGASPLSWLLGVSAH